MIIMVKSNLLSRRSIRVMVCRTYLNMEKIKQNRCFHHAIPCVHTLSNIFWVHSFNFYIVHTYIHTYIQPLLIRDDNSKLQVCGVVCKNYIIIKC